MWILWDALCVQQRDKGASWKYIFGAALQSFSCQRHTLTKTQNGFHHESCRQQKKLKLRVNTVNSAHLLMSSHFIIYLLPQPRNCCQVESPRQLNFVYKRCCVPSLRPGGFSVAVAINTTYQLSHYMFVILWSESVIDK